MIPATQFRVSSRWRTILRCLTAVVFVCAGANHFAHPRFYLKIVPPFFPAPAALVAISGACEIIGGIGLLIPPLQRAAGWGLLALLIAVFPANLYMALDPDRVPHGDIPVWLLWFRLPMQAVFIAWVWWVALKQPRSPHPSPKKTPPPPPI